MAIRRPTAATPDLSPATVAVLLGGWCAEAPEPSPHGFSHGFLELYDPHGPGFIRFWRGHEPWLREQARKWGWEPRFRLADGSVVFYAEGVAHLGGEHERAMRHE